MRLPALLVAAAAALAGAAPAASADETLRAGVGVVDASWHVGASAGQYATGRWENTDDADPHFHQFKNAPSYGVQSRLEMRAIVVEGAPNPQAPGGRNKFALVKTDLYIPQDLLYRRAAQLIREVAGRDIGIDRTNLTMATTHDHSSPYYTSTAWGAWTFQDAFDVRAYEYYARRIAMAVVEADENLTPVRMGGSTVTLDDVHRNSMGPKRADDGTPAGYPYGYSDHELHVVRFDDISGKKAKPLAVIVNYSNHPEGLDGNDLISADWIAAMERMIDRETGGTTIYTQNAVGSSEMERSTHEPPSLRREYYHREYAQGEHAARLTADAALEAWREVASPKAQVPFTERAVVDFHDAWFPGPLTHPYPAVSNCRTDRIFAADPDPRVPIVGLPDCQGPSDVFMALPFSQLPLPVNGPGLVYDTLRAAGVPVPANYGAPSFTGLEEDVSVHLQGFRVGDIFFPVCSCEQWADQSLNLKARTDRVEANETEGDNLGYDFSDRCEPAGDGNWSCPDGRSATSRVTITDDLYQRMRAQVNNDAFGWNSTAYAPYAESEPADPAQIKGNFTHDDNATSAALGYGMTVPISMANDYNGYIVSYREFQEGDHYRKALAGWGPHSSDYMTTRLVKLGRLMQGGPPLHSTIRDAAGNDVGAAGAPDPDADNVALQVKSDADVAHNDARARAIGTAATAAIAAYEAKLPDDGGSPEVSRQPEDVQRFDLAAVRWTGGSNYTDDPIVTVERRRGRRWETVADGSGEVVTTLALPKFDALPAYRLEGRTWTWTAHWETFVSRFDTGGGRLATRPGLHRFVISGQRREGGDVVPYRLTSDEFRVGEWAGITVEDLRREEDGRVSFRVGPRRSGIQHVDLGGRNPLVVPGELGPIDYPDSYARTRPDLKARFIAEQRNYARDELGGFQLYCLHCSFRPWRDLGDAESAMVTFARPDGTRRVEAQPSGGRWVTSEALEEGEAAYVCPGAVRDGWDNFNGTLSRIAGDDTVVLDCPAVSVVGATPTPHGELLPSGGAAAARLGLPQRARGGTLRVRPIAPRPELRLRRVSVRLGARTIAARPGRTLTLRRLPRRPFRVTVRALARDGRTYVASRRYR